MLLSFSTLLCFNSLCKSSVCWIHAFSSNSFTTALLADLVIVHLFFAAIDRWKALMPVSLEAASAFMVCSSVLSIGFLSKLLLVLRTERAPFSNAWVWLHVKQVQYISYCPSNIILILEQHCTLPDSNQLLSFLVSEWNEDKYSKDLDGHTLYASCGTECYVYTAKDGKVTRKQVLTNNEEHAWGGWHAHSLTFETCEWLKPTVRSCRPL
jgi:hypothetical protein